MLQQQQLFTMFSFSFLPFVCDQPLSLPLPDEVLSAGLIVSKGQIDYLTQLKHTDTDTDTQVLLYL